ncbi:maestro heat-like repeat-containing protein family member 6 isoform X2 [Hemicordylus capensis]|uniref:maestro heat-like repeat-containing protein family member 6 isoform X2 n=1 Tax=Hemicordylus capensis TaxID=884348 RepID=UPI00230210A5|nr:maestro heat-like repeat-containing protein family member 6 isoform X2 [Hemicordylus capensis]
MTSFPNAESPESTAVEQMSSEREKNLYFYHLEGPPTSQTIVKVQEVHQKDIHPSLVLEKSEDMLALAKSELKPATLSPSQAIISTLVRDTLDIQEKLGALLETSKVIKAEVSQMRCGIGEIKKKMERGDKCSSFQTPKAEQPMTWDNPDIANAIGEQLKQLPVRNPRTLAAFPGKIKDKVPEAPEPISEGKEEMKEMDPQISQAICPSQQERQRTHLGHEKCLSVSPLTDILLSAISGLSNLSPTNQAEAKMIKILEKHKASLKEQVPEIVDGICLKLSSFPNGNRRMEALHLVASLAEEYAEEVVSSLLQHSLPCNKNISEAWQSLCTSPETCTKILEHLLKVLEQRPGLQENSTNNSNSNSSCSNDMDWMAPLAIHFLVRLSGYLESNGKNASQMNMDTLAGHMSCAVKTLRILIQQDGNVSEPVWTKEMEIWGRLRTKEDYLEGVLLLASAMVKHGHPVISLLAEIIPKLQSEDEERNLTIKALFAGFLCSQSVSDLLPYEKILSILEEWQTDPRPTVRWLSLYGIGNLALHDQQVEQLETMVSVIQNSLKDPEERPVLEALKALGNILRHHQFSVRVGLVEKLQPLLVDERDKVRASTIDIFGILILNHEEKCMMQDQVLNILVPLLLQLQDENQDVAKNCRWTLSCCRDLLQWKLLEEFNMLAHHDIQAALRKFCKQLVHLYPGTIQAVLSQTVDFMKCPKAPVQRAAIMLAGFLVFYMEAKDVRHEDMASVLSGLGSLLDNPEPSISSAAAISIKKVKQACTDAATNPIVRVLKRMFFCFPHFKRREPIFGDNPFQRKPPKCIRLNF